MVIVGVDNNTILIACCQLSTLILARERTQEGDNGRDLILLKLHI